MIEDLNLDPLPDLPDELAELDAELRDIRMAERPSFGPELRSELERAWREGPAPEASSAGARRALAASIGAVLFVGMMVPPARAAIAEVSWQSLQMLGVVEPASTASRDPGPLARVASFDASPSLRDEGAPTPPRATGPTANEEAGPAGDGAPAEEAGSGLPELPRFAPTDVTIPELVDRNADEEAVRRYYPPNLEERGIGGSVFVRLWVDSLGSVDNIEVVGGSGYPEMDEAAARAAAELRFRPATRGSRAVGTLVEFEMTFEPLPSARRLHAVERPELPAGLDNVDRLWPDGTLVPAPYQVEARALLRSALGRPSDLERRFGSVENLLAGEPPPGVSPLRWRASATTALEEAVARDPGNPAPYLALGRIRKRQGLRADALALFEKGLEQARAGSRMVSPQVLAELSYERGTVLKHDWMSVRDLGRVPAGAVEEIRCSTGWNGSSVVDDMVGLNYLCHQELQRLMEESFQPIESDDGVRESMNEAFRAAVEAHPSHVGANVELLLDRADDGRWVEVLNGARSFAWASGGHPHALLLSGLALQRLGRPHEARDDFELAMPSLSEEEVRLLEDVRPLLSAAERKELAALSDSAGREWVETFWRGYDPLLLTGVNERRVEHLARATWALLRLGGVDTEAGEVWLRYGPPVVIRVLGEGTGLRTEFWRYARGPALTFRRPAHGSDLALTSEARAYLSDLAPTLPHLYGRSARPVAVLEAQVGRFRARHDEVAEVVVYSRVPEELATGEADTVAVGLFVTGADGEVLSSVRRSLSALRQEVRLTVPVADRARHMRLEIYHPGLGHAAAVRAPVRRDPADGEDPAISDLILTEPARPLTRDFRRHEPWLLGRTRGDDASGEGVGLLFELYDPAFEAGPYRVGVELEPEGRSVVVPVPVRPAGEDDFALEWPRAAADGPEFLTLDLSAVPPGRYTLRVVVNGFETGRTVVAERIVRR